MFDDAYTLVCGILSMINVDPNEAIELVYPPKWSSQIFQMESVLSPAEIRGVIFGIDPLSKWRDKSVLDYRPFATGHAFVFDVPADVMFGEVGPVALPSSTIGLHSSYGLSRHNFSDVKQFENEFTRSYKIE